MRVVFISLLRVFLCVFCLCRMEGRPPSLPIPALSFALSLPNPTTGLRVPLPPSPWDERDVALVNFPYQVPECDLPPHVLALAPSAMVSSSGGDLGLELLAEYNGQKFKYNDLVDIIMGTGHGVVGKKCEPLKARFKGVVETERGPEFLCRLLVGSSRGRCPQYPRHCVFKVSAFGACVLGSRETRYFSKLKPAMQERYVSYLYLYSYLNINYNLPFFSIRVMERANAGLHESYQKALQEVTRTKKNSHKWYRNQRRNVKQQLTASR